MAKDPAFNFYTNDFDQKTKFFSHEQVGMYLRLLMAQHQHGHLTEAQMMHICGRYDADVFGKFDKDPGGKFFNDRLDTEIAKRKFYSESRKKNRNAKKEKLSKSYLDTHDNHMSSHMENEYEIENDKDLKNKKEREEKTNRSTVEDVPRETDFTQPDVEGDELIFPIDTTAARELWARWKKYRWEKYQARYGFMGEQADLKRLERMTFNQIQSTILAAISAGWKNLYPEQNRQSNGTGNKKQQHTSNVAQYVAGHYEEKLRKGGAKPDG